MRTRLLYLCKTILLCLIIIACALGILLFPNDVRNGASSGISYCLYTLVPSLFPFMVLSSFIIHSGISKFIGKLLQPVIQFLFYLPGSAGSVIIMSMIGGYPVGARGCMSLLEQGAITQKQAQRMLYFCVNAGPAFIISVVGSTLLQNVLIGLLMFFSQIAAMLAIGITLGIIARFKKEPCHTVIPSERSSQSPLVESTLHASKGLMNMSAFVILFSAFLSLLHATGIAQGICQLLLRLHIPAPIAASIVSLLTEITSGCVDTASLNAPIALVAFGLGFGGFCVHFQIFAATLKCGVSKLKFIAFRFIHGIIAALVTMLFLPLFPQPTAYVFQNTSEQISGIISYSWPAGIALVACCAIFLFSVGLERRKSKVKG